MVLTISTKRSGGRRTMIELPLIFLGGLLGSAHCVGMCGGFAVSIGIGSRGLSSNLRRQLIYTAGRIFTYSFFGGVAGYAGFWIAGRASLWINIQAVLCMLAGIVLGAQGLLALGVLPRRYWSKLAGGESVCLAGTFIGPFLASPRSSHILLAGVLTGFLPCGLVYGYLALASSSASMWEGLLTMGLFGAGTGPLLILTGAGGSLLSFRARRNLWKVSAVCVSLTGLISIARGVLFLQITPAPDVIRCVLCGVPGG
jgi:sulfite exporter TauE/SafE